MISIVPDSVLPHKKLMFVTSSLFTGKRLLLNNTNDQKTNFKLTSVINHLYDTDGETI